MKIRCRLLLLGVHLRIQQSGVMLDDLRADNLHRSGHQTILLSEFLRKDNELAYGFGARDAFVRLIDPLLRLQRLKNS